MLYIGEWYALTGKSVIGGRRYLTNVTCLKILRKTTKKLRFQHKDACVNVMAYCVK